jgi:hypothetical protein
VHTQSRHCAGIPLRSVFVMSLAGIITLTIEIPPFLLTYDNAPCPHIYCTATENTETPYSSDDFDRCEPLGGCSLLSFAF